MKGLYENKKGSSFVMVLVVIAVLTVLGASILTLTLSSYKVRKSENDRKSNQYFSEAGLDEAYIAIGKYVNASIEEGNSAVDLAMDNFWQWLEKRELANAQNNVEGETTSETAGIDEDTDDSENSIFQEFIDDENNIIDSKVSEYRQSSFNAAFKNYFLGKKGNLKNHIENLNQNENSVKASVAIENIDDIDDAHFIHNELDIVLVSNFNQNNIEKRIQVTYTIKVPSYTQNNISSSEYIKLNKNPVWSKAITADGDMIINNGTVNISSGDIYIKGNEASGESDSGIIIKDPNCSLKSEENIITARDIVAYDGKGTSEGKSLDVAGNVYGRNLFIRKNTSGSDMKISKSLYLLDDVEIAGTNYNIDISGGFYGVSDGSKAEDNNPDNSSSIILNTTDIDTDSKISIGGPLYIAGTSYISTLNPKYQTGESISIIGNYRAYMKPLINDHFVGANGHKKNLKEDIKFNEYGSLHLASEYVSESKGDISSIINWIDVSNKITSIKISLNIKDIENSEFKGSKNYCIEYTDLKGQITDTDIVPLDSSVELNALMKNGSTITVKFYDTSKTRIIKEEDVILIRETLNATDKSEYFKAYQQDYGKDSGLILGKGQSSDEGFKLSKLDSSIHLGAVLTGKEDSVYSGNWWQDGSNFIKAKRVQLKDKIFFMDFGESIDINNNKVVIQNVDEVDNSVDVDDNTDLSSKYKEKYNKIENIQKPYIAVDGKGSCNSLIKFGNIPGGEYTYGINKRNINPWQIDTSKKYSVILDGNHKNYAFLGKNEALPADIKADAYKIINLGDNSFNGMVITNGDVYFAGEVNFTGTVITSGSIKFYDDKEKTFNYYEGLIKKMIAEKYNGFVDKKGNGFKDIFINNSKEFSYIEVFSGNTQPEQVIKIKDWVMIK